MRATFQAERGYVRLIRRCCELPCLFLASFIWKIKMAKEKNIHVISNCTSFYKDYFELNNASLQSEAFSKILCGLANRYIIDRLTRPELDRMRK